MTPRRLDPFLPPAPRRLAPPSPPPPTPVPHSSPMPRLKLGILPEGWIFARRPSQASNPEDHWPWRPPSMSTSSVSLFLEYPLLCLPPRQPGLFSSPWRSPLPPSRLRSSLPVGTCQLPGDPCWPPRPTTCSPSTMKPAPSMDVVAQALGSTGAQGGGAHRRARRSTTRSRRPQHLHVLKYRARRSFRSREQRRSTRGVACRGRGGKKRSYFTSHSLHQTARGGCPMALILSTTVNCTAIGTVLQPTSAAEAISSRGGRGQRQLAEAISRGNQQSRAGGSGISRSAWSSRRRGRSALPCLPSSSRGERRPGLAAAAGVAAVVRNRRAGHEQGQGREQGHGKEAPVEVVALEEQPQLGDGAARVRAGGPRSQWWSNRRWATTQVVARSFYGGCRRWLRRPLGRRRKKQRKPLPKLPTQPALLFFSNRQTPLLPHGRMDAGAPLLSFTALLPCSPARPPPPPRLPTPSLLPVSRSSPASLACLLNLPSFTPKIVSSSSRCVSCLRATATRPPRCPRHRRRHGESSSGSRCACATSGARGPTRRSPPRPCASPQRRRKGIPFAASDVLLESLLFGPLLTSLIKKQNNMAQLENSKFRLTAAVAEAGGAGSPAQAGVGAR
ncbi:uncharacterized protein [Triticum aestivum]|uniref:uncharacterized protein isoform X2 n=1 Tax=Triticum aestivum TaxID=4565 RepID=UPI001D013036|nr:uncharacterized protein LOC123137686 isoform X2 [Triticum aestivum]